MRSVRLRHEGVVMRDADSLLRSCCAPATGTLVTITQDPVRVLVPGESAVFMRYDRNGADDPVYAAFNRERWKTDVEVCYCSVLDDCWTLTTRPAEPEPREAQPVATCPRLPVEARYKG